MFSTVSFLAVWPQDVRSKNSEAEKKVKLRKTKCGLTDSIATTSSAESATLGDTSWARLINKKGPSNTLKKQSVDSSCKLELDRLESKTEPSVAPHRNICTGRGGHRTYLLDDWNDLGGDTAQHWKKAYSGRGGHRTYFVGVGTPHNIYRKSLAVGGWVVPVRE